MAFFKMPLMKDLLIGTSWDMKLNALGAANVMVRMAINASRKVVKKPFCAVLELFQYLHLMPKT